MIFLKTNKLLGLEDVFAEKEANVVDIVGVVGVVGIFGVVVVGGGVADEDGLPIDPRKNATITMPVKRTML